MACSAWGPKLQEVTTAPIVVSCASRVSRSRVAASARVLLYGLVESDPKMPACESFTIYVHAFRGASGPSAYGLWQSSLVRRALAWCTSHMSSTAVGTADVRFNRHCTGETHSDRVYASLSSSNVQLFPSSACTLLFLSVHHDTSLATGWLAHEVPGAVQICCSALPRVRQFRLRSPYIAQGFMWWQLACWIARGV